MESDCKHRHSLTLCHSFEQKLAGRTRVKKQRRQWKWKRGFKVRNCSIGVPAHCKRWHDREATYRKHQWHGPIGALEVPGIEALEEGMEVVERMAVEGEDAESNNCQSVQFHPFNGWVQQKKSVLAWGTRIVGTGRQTRTSPKLPVRDVSVMSHIPAVEFTAA
eukprot:scaffold138104_cov23-Tisochrysis_lutea.AAC.1